jgi:hypothetical protein
MLREKIKVQKEKHRKMKQEYRSKIPDTQRTKYSSREIKHPKN